MTYILGIAGNAVLQSQDPAAALLKDGQIIAAAEEERFTRQKHARGQFPIKAIQFCLKQAKIKINQVEYLAYHVNYKDNEQKTIDRITNIMEFNFGFCPKIKFVDHHDSHAATTYYPSKYKDAIILSMDVSGNGISTRVLEGKNNKIIRKKEFKKPNSLGIYYSLLTQFLGFEFGNQEYVAMGLSSYGKPTYMDQMKKILWPTKEGYKFDDSIYINRPVDNLYYKSRQERQFHLKLTSLLGLKRLPNSEITQRHMDIAKSMQEHLNEIVIHLLKLAKKEIKSDNLCLSGGVAMNCVMNGALLRSGLVKNVYVPPCATDAGNAIGAALKIAYDLGYEFKDPFLSPYLGPGFTNEQIKKDLDLLQIKYKKVNPAKYIAKELPKGKIIGLFQGRMEFGARALGNRTILADPRNPKMKDLINERIKFREEFRPFAPSVLMEEADKWFKDAKPSPYMTFVFDVLKPKQIPAVTHVDGTARIQTVTKEMNPTYYEIIKEFQKETGVPVVLNTSLNVKGEPVVCSPKNAMSTFYGSGMDAIILGDYLVEK